jgi:hypothetical protein
MISIIIFQYHKNTFLTQIDTTYKTKFIEELKKGIIHPSFNGNIDLPYHELNNLHLLLQNQYKESSGEKDWKPKNSPNSFENICNDINSKFCIEEKENLSIKPEYLRNFFYPRKILKENESYGFRKAIIEILYLYSTAKMRNEYNNSVTLYIMCENQDKDEIKELTNNLNLIDNIIKPIIGNTNILNELKKKSGECLALFISKNLLNSEYLLGQCVDANEGLLMNEAELKNVFFIISNECTKGQFNIYDSTSIAKMSNSWNIKSNKLKKSINKLFRFNKNIKLEHVRQIEKLKNGLWGFLSLVTGKYNGHSFILPNQSIEFKNLLYDFRNSELNIRLKTIKNKEELILHSNKIILLTDRRKRIFPPEPYFNPNEITKLIKIDVEDFSNVFIKNEYENPTGTHKDRMAWEIVLKYKDLFNLKNQSGYSNYNGPNLSIISYGSAAFSLQYFFRLYGIPKLKVLIDKSFKKKDVVKHLEDIGCEMYYYDLSKRLLNSEDIKELTSNKDGFDITYREPMDASAKLFYDYLSFEILNESPDYCFIPFGTGDLFLNVIKILEMQFMLKKSSNNFDHRFSGNLDILRKCNFMASTTINRESSLDKLYSYFHPNRKAYVREVKNLIKYGYIGKLSNIINVSEENVLKSMIIAKKNQG